MSKIFVDTIESKTSGNTFASPALAFMAQKTDVNTYSTQGNITFNRTLLANNAWDGTTFTAPRAGIYRFFVNGHHNSLSAAALETAIMVNNTAIVYAYSLNTTSTRVRVFNELIYELALNDTVNFYLSGGDVYAGNASGVTCGGQYLGSSS